MGLAFENLVIDNYRELLSHVHLDGSRVMSAGPYRTKGTKGLTVRPTVACVEWEEGIV